ncbi:MULTISPECIES: sugar phosphate nucleotidyltransferase [Cupriavidus]
MWTTLIVAGGFGTRLSPFTKVIPKPLMPIGDHSLLERHIRALAKVEARDIYIAIHYCADLFGSIVEALASRYGVHIHLVLEQQPKGTFGSALALCREFIDRGESRPLMVLNGDIASDLDLVNFHGFHVASGADFSVAVNDYIYRVPYGVVESRESRMLGVKEKPAVPFPVLAGYYLMQPSISRLLGSTGDCELGVDKVLSLLLERGSHVSTYQHHGKWIDAGTIEDLHRANELFSERGMA